MKKIFFSTIVLFVVLALYSIAFSAAIRWQLTAHPADFKKLGGEMSAMVNKGYAPVGISLVENRIYILYLDDPDRPISSWKLNAYQKKEEWKKGLTDMMTQGYTPAGLTYAEGTVLILYVKTPNTTNAWKTVVSKTTPQAVKKAITGYFEKDYVPVGITVADDTFFTLMARMPKTRAGSWGIESVPADGTTIKKEIDKKLKEGKLPWGFLMRGNAVNLLFVSFKKPATAPDQAASKPEPHIKTLSSAQLERHAEKGPYDIRTVLEASPFFMGAYDASIPEIKEYVSLRLGRVRELLALLDHAEPEMDRAVSHTRGLRESAYSFLIRIYKAMARTDKKRLKSELYRAIEKLTLNLAETDAHVFNFKAVSRSLKGAGEIYKFPMLSRMTYERFTLLGSAAGLLSREISLLSLQCAAWATFLEQNPDFIKDSQSMVREFQQDYPKTLRNALTASQKALSYYYRIGYGIRTLEVGDYVFLKGMLERIKTELPEMSRKASAIRAREGLSSADIQFARNNFKLLESMTQYLDTQYCSFQTNTAGYEPIPLPKSLRTRLASLLRTLGPRSAYAVKLRKDGWFSNLGKHLKQAYNAPLDYAVKGAKNCVTSPWQCTKSAFKGAQQTAGVMVDTTDLVVGNLSDMFMEQVYGVDMTDVMEQRKQEKFAAWDRGEMGDKLMKQHVQDLRDAEDAAKWVTETNINKAEAWVKSKTGLHSGGYLGWGAGWMAKLAVGMKTSLNKGLTLLANPKSSPGELAEGTLDVVLSSSKVTDKIAEGIGKVGKALIINPLKYSGEQLKKLTTYVTKGTLEKAGQLAGTLSGSIDDVFKSAHTTLAEGADSLSKKVLGTYRDKIKKILFSGGKELDIKGLKNAVQAKQFVKEQATRFKGLLAEMRAGATIAKENFEGFTKRVVENIEEIPPGINGLFEKAKSKVTELAESEGGQMIAWLKSKFLKGAKPFAKEYAESEIKSETRQAIDGKDHKGVQAQYGPAAKKHLAAKRAFKIALETKNPKVKWGEKVTGSIRIKGGVPPFQISGPLKGTLKKRKGTFTLTAPRKKGVQNIVFIATDAGNHTARASIKINVTLDPLSAKVTLKKSTLLPGFQVYGSLEIKGGHPDFHVKGPVSGKLTKRKTDFNFRAPTEHGTHTIKFTVTDDAKQQVVAQTRLTVGGSAGGAKFKAAKGPGTEFSGSFKGGMSGHIQFKISGSTLSGYASGPFGRGNLLGMYNPKTGSISATIFIRGAKMRFTGKRSGNTCSGKWNMYGANMSSGTWSADRRTK